MKKFLRRTWDRYSKLGKKRKKKQKWRRPTGRDNKMREKTKGHPKVVSVGYKKSKKMKKKNQIVVRNILELEKVKKNQIVIVGRIGKKKKIEIAKKAKKMKIPLQNLNIEKFLKKLENKK
ncbi:MAG: 50S ribosomal protein L32e [Nanoarchaeota archaeon]|nr:50S ribosomal protein L32e [Nanoarchaeota archaeon]